MIKTKTQELLDFASITQLHDGYFVTKMNHNKQGVCLLIISKHVFRI